MSSNKLTFPARLYEVLSKPELSQIITWLPSGEAWIVLDTKAFSEVIAPRYFSNQTKYASFMRQVNGWGFRRMNMGPGKSVYYHEFFIRGRPDLLRNMVRQSAGATFPRTSNLTFTTTPSLNPGPLVGAVSEQFDRLSLPVPPRSEVNSIGIAYSEPTISRQFLQDRAALINPASLYQYSRVSTAASMMDGAFVQQRPAAQLQVQLQPQLNASQLYQVQQSQGYLPSSAQAAQQQYYYLTNNNNAAPSLSLTSNTSATASAMSDMMLSSPHPLSNGNDNNYYASSIVSMDNGYPSSSSLVHGINISSQFPRNPYT